jgi:hypothetical protein
VSRARVLDLVEEENAHSGHMAGLLSRKVHISLFSTSRDLVGRTTIEVNISGAICIMRQVYEPLSFSCGKNRTLPLIFPFAFWSSPNQTALTS